MTINKQKNETAETSCVCHPVRHTFKRVLVAMDYSDQSDYAADIAASMAAEQHAQVVLTHVCHLPVSFETQTLCTEPDLVSVCMDAAEGLLASVKEKMPASLHVETDLRQGDPAEEILKSAASHRADLIVMGTHSRGRFSQAMTGSVARTVSHKAPCPVLTVALPSARQWSTQRDCPEMAGVVLQ